MAAEADDEVREILSYNYERAKKLLKDNKNLLEEMAKLLIERETIYKEEVDMIMQGQTTEEIVKYMEKKEKAQKAKEAKIREKQLQAKKLEEYKNKVEEGKKLLDNGIITKEEYQMVLDEYQAQLAKAAQPKQEKVEKPKAEEA